MPPKPNPPGRRRAAEALVRTAPLVSRWIERLLAAHDPPLTVAQYLALQAIDEGEIVGAELARRVAVSPAAISQLLATLESSGYLSRAARHEDDRRRQPLALTERGESTVRSAQTAWRERLSGLLVDLPPREADGLARHRHADRMDNVADFDALGGDPFVHPLLQMLGCERLDFGERSAKIRE